MITNIIYHKCHAWESYNIQVGTAIDPTTTPDLPDGLLIEQNVLYPIKFFYTPQSPSDYDPEDESTWSGTPFYSGNLYFSSNKQLSDINEILRDQLDVLPFLQLDSIPMDYYLNAGHYELPLLAGLETVYNAGDYKYFVCITDLSTNSTLEICIMMTPNYTYDIENPFQDIQYKLSDPILNIIAPSQYVPLTLYTGDVQAPSNFRFTFYDDNNSYPVNLQGEIANTLSSLCTEFFAPDLILDDAYSKSFDDVKLYVDIADEVNESLTLKDTRYEVDPCIRYVLYYKNLYGGWDWMVVRGTVKKTITQSTNSFNQGLYLGTQSDVVIPTNKFILQPEISQVQNKYLPNTKIYNNGITTELKINLGWFTDEQVLKLPNLFLSTNVYLHDLQENKFDSVIITDKSFEEKKYKEGKAINKYSIKVEYNQIKNIK